MQSMYEADNTSHSDAIMMAYPVDEGEVAKMKHRGHYGEQAVLEIVVHFKGRQGLHALYRIKGVHTLHSL